jgi:nitrite reductase/ring-hydroxylating ferredoxin subunit/uncharacterized membrane protein
MTKMTERLLDALEKASWLDPLTDKVEAVLTKVVRDGVIKDTLSGTALGHPAHPVLVAVPLGSFVAASYLDLAGNPTSRDAAGRLVGLGLVSAVPAALTGGSDWLDTTGAERRIGAMHAMLNWSALGVYGASWIARRRGHHGVGTGLALAGASVLTAAGYLGGHLAYAMGVGVDTTAFQKFPADWTDVAADADILAGQAYSADAAGVPVLLSRVEGQVTAIADRCTHRGAPLHEGEIEGGCIVCPWHGSKFDLVDGSIEQGPATRPQPVFEVQVVDERVQVRRSTEQRSLRKNPVGV